MSSITRSTPGDGRFDGGGGELLKDQVVAAGAVVCFSGVLSHAIALGVEQTIGLRVTVDDELVGLDQSQHDESAYQA